MANNEVEQLKKRISSLESELSIREKDLNHYKSKLEEANEALEVLTLDMEQQVHLLQAIQKHLTPTEFSHIPGFEFSFKFVPSKISGGDYFDLFEHDTKSRFGVIMTSASGYGTSALLLSILLRLSGPLKTKKGGAPSEVIKTLSAELRETMSPKDDCHLFYGQVDRSSFEFNYCIAGDMVALHYKFHQGELEKLESGGGPINKHKEPNLNSMNIQLNPRDRLIICSRGVLEMRNKEEYFGEERLFRTVLAVAKKDVHEIRNEVLYQIKTFLKNEESQRDVTVLVVEVKDKVIKLARNHQN
jgi:phosphoserine phosphatase RsbU/P